MFYLTININSIYIAQVLQQWAPQLFTKAEVAVIAPMYIHICKRVQFSACLQFTAVLFLLQVYFNILVKNALRILLRKYALLISEFPSTCV